MLLLFLGTLTRPSALPPPPPPFPPIFKIIAVDSAYGSDGLARSIAMPPAIPVFVGDTAMIAVTVEPWEPLTFGFALLFTRPDGSQFALTPPQANIGTTSLGTSAGVYEPGTYLLGQLGPGVLNQFGRWTVQTARGGQLSVPGYFFVGRG
jgi:hypothetical protein